MELRPYQQAAINAIKTEYQKGVHQQLLSAATGTGKTCIFSSLPESLKDILPGQTMVLAHREELIDQSIDKMRLINPNLKVDKEMAEHVADPNADVIVASVATLGRKGTKRANQFNWERIDKLVTDEAHHSVATTYQNIYDVSGVLQPDSKKLLLGVTATPSRGDGQALAKIYKKIVYVYSIRQAIEDGWLVDIRGVRISTKTNLDTVKTVGGDFAQDMLADAVNNPQRNQLVAKAWLDHGGNRQTLGFSVDIKHAQDLAEMFKQYHVKAEAVWGTDPDRAEKLLKLRNGEITVLFNCGVLTEGYDDWHIGCIILARPTKSSTLFTQMVGRGTRLQDGTGNLKVALDKSFNYGTMDNIRFGGLKKDCIVIDVVDNTFKHSLVTLPTLMGMNGTLDLSGKSLVGAIKSIEEAQKQYSHIDFSSLKNIDQLQTFIESVNLFEVKFPPEVEECSKLSWHTSADGGFILLLPNREEVRIKQNMLDKWDLTAVIRGQKYRGERNSIEEAFAAADNLVNEKAVESLKILRREEKWHSAPPTIAQLNLLRKFYRGRAIPDSLTKGSASKLIGSFLAGKA
jgi:ATP-dependent helicase IRC3